MNQFSPSMIDGVGQQTLLKKMRRCNLRIKAMFCRCVREVAVKRDGDVFVAADAILDGFAIFLAMNQSFP